MPSKTENIEQEFQKISQNLEELNQSLKSLLPRAIIREVSSFGNSAHVILLKELSNKKVGVIILDETK